MQPNLLGKLEPTTISKQEYDKKDGVGDSNMDQQDFLNLLITQLKNQDPINPVDNAEFMSQTTAFSQLNEMTTMNASMNKILEFMAMQAFNNNSLTAGAGFIGKEIEYQTNTVTVGKDSLKNISFYLAENAASGKSQINIFNEEGSVVAVVKPEKDLKSGENIIHWDGTGVGGVKVPDGTYYFEVQAYNTKGEQIQVQEYGTGIVKGVKMSNGTLFFDIGSGVVSSEYVYSVYDPKTKPDTDTDGNTGNSEPKPDTSKPDTPKPQPETPAPPPDKPENGDAAKPEEQQKYRAWYKAAKGY